MKLKISQTICEEIEPAIEDAFANTKRGTPDPSDPVYIKIAEAVSLTKGAKGCVIDASQNEVAELLDRAEYKIEVAIENMSDEPAFWRGQLAAWRALVKQIKAAS